MKDLINSKTRLELRELMTSMPLREIDDEFMAVGLRPDEAFTPSVPGQRRGRIEQYYHAMNFLKPEDARKFILLCENFLTDNPNFDGTKVLLRWLERDGYTLRDGALVALAPSHNREQLEAAAGQLGAVHLGDLLTRMREALGQNDPDLVIGTSKELIECCCKTILSERKLSVPDSPKIPELLRLVRTELKLVPETVPSQKKGADSIRRILGSLAAIGQGIAELRSLYGTGHGREGTVRGLTMRHARLICGAAESLSNFLFETHQDQLGLPNSTTSRSAP